MGIEPRSTDRRSQLFGAAALIVASAGVLQFLLSLVTWAFFYVGSYRNGWRDVLTLNYGAVHVSPAVVLLSLFLWTSIVTFRRRRFALRLLLCSVLLSIGAFAIEVRADPQFQRVWIDDPTSCSNRQSYYCTWWWWQPTRHK